MHLLRLISAVIPALMAGSLANAASVSYSGPRVNLYSGDVANIPATLSGFNGPANCNAFGLPPGFQIDPNTCAITGNAPMAQAPGQQFNVSVNTPFSPPTSLAIVVLPNAISYPSKIFFAGDTVNLTPKLTGYTGAKLPNCAANGLPSGLQIDPSSCVIYGNAPNVGPTGNLFNVTVNSMWSPPIQFTMEIDANGVAYPSSSLTLYTGDQVSLVPRLIGFNGGRPAGCSANNLPPGLTIDNMTCAITGQIMSPPGTGQIYNATVTTSANPGVSTPLTFNVLAAGVLYPSAAVTFYSGDSVNLVPRIVGYAGRSPQCSSSSLPSGLKVDPNSCAITGMVSPVPPSGIVTNSSVSVMGGVSVTLQFTLLASGVIYPTTQPSFVSGDAVSFVPRVVGFNNGQNLFCTASGLPQGLYINAYTCEIAGRPGSVPSPGQIFNVTVSAPSLPPISLQMSIYAPMNAIRSLQIHRNADLRY